MISLTPGSAPADAHGVVALIALVTDPKACKQRLAELTDQAAKADAAQAELMQAQQDLDAKRHDAEAVIEAAAARAGQLDQREQAIAVVEKSVREREQAHAAKVEQHNSEVQQNAAALQARERKVAAREDAATSREQTLAAERAKFNEDRRGLDAQLAKAREFMKV